MLFTETEDSDEIYRFATTIETQFCANGEYDIKEGLPNELVEDKISYAKSLIGKAFEINLYKFTVKELTNGKYAAIKLYRPDGYYKTIEDYHIASYKTKEDVMMLTKHSIALQGVQGNADGVFPDESTEKITTELFFQKPILDKKDFEIHYGNYPNLTASYIVNEVPINDIRKGCNLAYKIGEMGIPRSDFNNYIHQIEDYRSRVITAKMINESLRKKIFFWEQKEVVEELKFSLDIISLFKDCIILGKSYPIECDKADQEYVEELEKKIRRKFLNENTDINDFKKQFFEFRLSIIRKYKGKNVIKLID